VTAIVKDSQGNRITCVKGAPAAVLQVVEDESGVDHQISSTYNDKVAEFASRGFRSLGVAWKKDGEKWQVKNHGGVR
jgi:H+-transporting ATPase